MTTTGTSTTRSVSYYYTRVEDRPGKAYELLAELATESVDLLAFSAIPYGPNFTELTLFPTVDANLVRAAGKLGWELTGPQHAFLVQGDDHLGALAGIHQRLLDAEVNIYASSGITDGRGRYGYVIYVKEEDFAVAAEALGADPA